MTIWDAAIAAIVCATTTAVFWFMFQADVAGDKLSVECIKAGGSWDRGACVRR